MKKSLTAMAALSTLAGAVHAQSSVTLYGLIDEGPTYVSNAGGHNQVMLQSGLLNASRWGMTGAEDLGGGLKAIFTLENGYNVNTGALGNGGLEFGRKAIVGLSGNFGTVTVGRQFNFTPVSPLTANTDWAGGNFSRAGDVDNLNNNYGISNSIKYDSRTYSGFKFGGLYSLGGVAGNFSRNQIWSINTSYTNGPVQAAAEFTHVNNPNTALYANNGGNTTGTVNNISSNPIYGGYASAHSMNTFAAGAAYTLGAATIGAVYSHVNFKDVGDATSAPVTASTTSSTSPKFDSAELSVKYMVTPSLQLATAYDYTQGSSNVFSGVSQPAAKYNMFTIGADYYLSKRTDIYATAVYEKASGVDSTGKHAVAYLIGTTASSTDRQLALHIAIRHKF